MCILLQNLLIKTIKSMSLKAFYRKNERLLLTESFYQFEKQRAKKYLYSGTDRSLNFT